ncbi:polyhydroxyalkanoic acid system family protein [Denitrificimonas sp. JX-1]|uniref:Polyhydroxyalkanoic acid system family protein n=1 Tax=Denitrificimonas halotolerans TaxID=3098930 RepID=A0ABU5GR89_9GAMM|nr:polyhydroxyalkanoic acid system family protein [Denitrificimonas sp. JX-1]MDY7219289.1 polyhydroxyalkanoic acid system family protein [Denitrificimonas sp. JX-1]
MSKIVVEREHNLGRDVAREKAQQLADRLVQQYDVTYKWVGDTLEFHRTGASGSIDVEEDKVRVNLKLGLLLSGLSGTIKREIEDALDKRLA